MLQLLLLCKLLLMAPVNWTITEVHTKAFGVIAVNLVVHHRAAAEEDLAAPSPPPPSPYLHIRMIKVSS